MQRFTLIRQKEFNFSIVKTNFKYLLLFLIYWLLCLTPISTKAFKNPEVAFQFLTDDSVLLDIYGYYDNAGLLDGYTSHVITPVCEDSSCYNAEIDLFWDLTGNFKTFKIIPKNPLTKLDHIPFTKADYNKLMQVLFIKSPSFVYMKRSQLVVNDNPEVDGITSATAAQVKEDMVYGAIYTCYTLWHIANGQIVFKIKEHTANNLNKQLIKKLLMSEKVEEHFLIISAIDADYFSIFLHQILALADRHKGYFIMSVIDNMPASLMKSGEVQDFFTSNFSQMEYQVKNKLLEKLYNVPLKSSLQVALINGILPGNSIQNEKIIRLVIKNIEKKNFEEIIKMFEAIKIKRIKVSEELHTELIALGDQYKPLIKEVRRYSKAHGK